MTSYIFETRNNSKALPLFLEKDQNYVSVINPPDKKMGDITYYPTVDKTAVYVETIKSHNRAEIAGMGFFLMQMAIGSSPSCRTTLCSEGLGEGGERSPVLFYSRLGFVPKFTCLESDEKTRRNALLLEQELIMAKREARDPVWNVKMPMALPENARRKWQVVAVSNEFLQEQLEHNQRIIKIIHDYFLNFLSSDFLPGIELSLPPKTSDYVFQTNTGKEVMTYHSFSPPDLRSVWSHKISLASKEVGCIEVKNKLEAPSNVKKLINFTHLLDHADYIPGISFFLIKKTLESLPRDDLLLTKLFVGTEAYFFYWRLGFRFCKDEADEEQMKQCGRLEEEFTHAQQENRKPQNCPRVFVDIMLSEESKSAWRCILAIDPILQDIFKKKQKIIQLVQKYLL